MPPPHPLMQHPCALRMSTDPPIAAPTIASDRVTLRPVALTDAPAIARYRADPEVARYQSWSGYTVADAEALCRAQAAVVFATPGTWCQLAIALRETNEVIGDCGLHFAEDGSAQMEIGFTLARDHQGRGLATEAIASVLDCAFGPVALHRVTARIDARNAPAAALLGRLGFRCEGRFAQCALFKGAWCDEESHAILAREWASHPQSGRATIHR